MRFPRVRMSIGSLIILVALASVNCAVGRWVYDVIEHGSNTTAPGELAIALLVGCLPFINIAVAGGMRFVFRLFRSGRGQSTAAHRPAAMTFFSWHLLALIFFVVYFMPNIPEAYIELVEIGLDFMTERCEGLLERFNEVFTDFVIPIGFLAIGVSGPLLLIAGIGTWLARRSARKLPVWRFRVMSGLVSLGFVGTAFAIAATIQPYNEEQSVDLTFEVIDAKTHKPIDAATIRIVDPFDRFSTPPVGSTSGKGRAVLTATFPSCGERNAYQTLGEVSFWGRWLEVSAPGYPIQRIPLTDVLESRTELRHAYSGQIALRQDSATSNAFEDLAGSYALDYVGGTTFVIETDGRYSWVAWGCMAHSQGFGYIQRHENQLLLKEIPYVGEPVNPRQRIESYFGSTIRTVAWGERVYLALDDLQVYHICRDALRSLKAVEVSSRDHFLRRSDRQKPQAGFPNLPAKVWVAFLANELSLANEDGMIRSTIESLLPEVYQARNRRYQSLMLSRLSNS